MTNEIKVIKLTPEMILDRQVQLEQTKINLENLELNIKQMERLIEIDFPKLQAQAQLNTLKKQVDTLKHNIVALTEQLKTGEMS